MAVPIYIADTDGLRSVELEGLSVMFHPRSGMTHILAPPSPQILDVLGEGPRTPTASSSGCGRGSTCPKRAARPRWRRG
jgi:hypothetical protein